MPINWIKNDEITIYLVDVHDLTQMEPFPFKAKKEKNLIFIKEFGYFCNDNASFEMGEMVII